MKRLLWLLPLMLCGCTGAEFAAGATVIGGLFMGYQKIKHPVAGAISENPAAFWQTILAVIGLLTAMVTLASKAGKDHKRKER